MPQKKKKKNLKAGGRCAGGPGAENTPDESLKIKTKQPSGCRVLVEKFKMTQSVNDETTYVNALKEALANDVRYVLSKYNEGKDTMSITFHQTASLAGMYLFVKYGAEGLKSLKDGKTVIKEIIADPSKAVGISTTRLKCEFVFE